MKKLTFTLVFLLPLILAAQVSDSIVLKRADSLLVTARTICGEGKFEEATQLNAAAERLIVDRFGTEKLSYVWICFNYGWVYDEAGNYPEAEKWYLKATDLTERLMGKENVYHIINLNNLGLLYGNMGNFEKALPYYLESIQISKKLNGPEHPYVISAIHNLGASYQQMGELEKAEQTLYGNLAVTEKVFGKEGPEYASALNSLAIVCIDMGNYKKAEAYTLQAIDSYGKSVGEDHPRYANGLNSLAGMYLRTGAYQKAESAYLKILAIREKSFGKQHPEYAGTLINLGVLQKKMGNYAAAEKLLLEARDILKKSPGESHPDYATTLQTLAEVYQAMGRWDQAETLYLTAQDLTKNNLGVEHLDYQNNLTLLAKFYLGKKQPEEAATYLSESDLRSKNLIRRATTHLSEQEMQSYLATFQQHSSLLYAFSHQYPDPEITARGFDNALFYKGFLLNNTLQLEKILATAPAELQEQFLQWKALQRQLSDAYSQTVSKRKNVGQLESQLNELEKELAHQLAGFRDARRDVQWEEIQRHLTNGEAVVEFVRYNVATQENQPKELFYGALLLKPGARNPQFVPLFAEKQLANLNATRNLYANQSTGAQPNLKALIWQPLATHLADVKTLYYSPAGLLHRINLGAIPVSDTETVGDRFVLHHLGTSRQLALPASSPSQGPHEALILGGIHYDDQAPVEEVPGQDAESEGGRGIALPEGSLGEAYRSLRDDRWPYLEWTKKEAETVQKMAEKSNIHTTLLQGADASEENFKKIGVDAPSPTLLHLATHGYFFPDADTTAATGFRASQHPLIRSGLILAGANAAWQGHGSGTGEDGILTAHEIAQMNLKNTELVVLSACDTGLGELEGNEGVYGLQRAFKLAGAKYVIMSLWKVSDRQTYEFMSTFYREWLEKGLEIPAAFQSAQRQMREKYSVPFNPASWAGFVLAE